MSHHYRNLGEMTLDTILYLILLQVTFHSAQIRCITDGRGMHSSSELEQVNAAVDRQVQTIMEESKDLMQVYKLLLPRALINKVRKEQSIFFVIIIINHTMFFLSVCTDRCKLSRRITKTSCKSTVLAGT